MSPDLLAELLRPTATTYQRFLVEWHGERRPEFGVPAAQLPSQLPRKLREFYEFAGRWPQAVVFNRLIDPNELKPAKDGKLVFCIENQGVVSWAVEVEHDDPAVFIKGSTIDDPKAAAGWRAEGEPLSRFLLQLMLFEAIMMAPFGGVALAQPEETCAAILAPLSQLPLAGWHWPAPTRGSGPEMI